MGAEPVLLEVCVETFDDFVDGQAGGVGGGDGAGLAMPEDFFEEGALDVEVLGDDFDDPVAGCDQGHVVVEVAEGDEAGGFGREEGGGLGFFQAVEGGEDEFVARGGLRVWCCAGRDDVEKDDGDAGVGDVGGDAGAHGSGAEDGDFADLTAI